MEGLLTGLDIRYNIEAFLKWVFDEEIGIPEQAFAYVSDQNYKMTEKDYEDAYKLRKEGVKLKDVAEMYQVDNTILSKCLTKRFGKIKPRELPKVTLLRQRKETLQTEHINILMHFKNRGYNNSEISKITGLPSMTVIQIMRRVQDGNR